jgi:pimeloyl-ACP methyl ester carboxylesterase
MADIKKTTRPVAFLLALVGMAFLAAASANAADSWKGAGLMAGGKGYAPTPMGQVSFRDIGPRTGKAPFLLIHEAFMSMIEFAEIQDELAKLGYRSIAVDTPGYGMSDPAPGQPGIADLADNLVPVLDYLKVKKVVIAGHHTGAMIAASFAARRPDRVVAVILHGSPYFNKEESEKGAADNAIDRTPRADGSHVTRSFAGNLPGDEVSQQNLNSRTWMLIMKFMMGPDIGHYAVYHHDMGPDLQAIRAPTLLMTDAHDGIREQDERAAKLRPDFRFVVFSDYANMQMMNEPARWAKLVTDFAAPYEK